MLTLRNLLRRKTRTLLTVIGVGAGIAAVVALIAVARGFRQQLNNFVGGGNAHLAAIQKGASDPFISFLPDTILEDLRDTEGVRSVHPLLLSVTQVPGRSPFFFCYGTTAGSPFLSQIRIVEGRSVFAPGAADNELCLGRIAADNRGLSVGSRLTVGSEEYEVVGIFESTTRLLSAGSLVRFHDAQRIAGLEGKMSSALIQLDELTPEALAAGEAALEAKLTGVEVTAAAEFTNAFEEFELADQAVAVLSFLAILVGGIGVMNTMLMSVFERTREFGILQAVGWSKGMILRHVLAEGLAVCLLGGALGIALGIGLVEGISSLGELAWVSGNYSLSLLLEALLVAVCMGFIGSAYPALRAVGITPIEALRYE